jgi:hypothetical protein
MSDTAIIPSKHQPVTASSDDFGQYGTMFAPDSDREIPQPLNLYNEATLLEIADNSNAVRAQIKRRPQPLSQKLSSSHNSPARS